MADLLFLTRSSSVRAFPSDFSRFRRKRTRDRRSGRGMAYSFVFSPPPLAPLHETSSIASQTNGRRTISDNRIPVSAGVRDKSTPGGGHTTTMTVRHLCAGTGAAENTASFIWRRGKRSGRCGVVSSGANRFVGLLFRANAENADSCVAD